MGNESKSRTRIPPLTHTLGHVHCAPCTVTRDTLLQSNALVSLTFDNASSVWLEDKKLFIKERTYKDYKQYIKSMMPFFKGCLIKDIHAGMIREYQKWRVENGVGGQRINHELGAMAQLLNEAGKWGRIKPKYKRLPENPIGPGIALTQEEAEHLFKVGKSKPRWSVGLWAAILSANSTAGPGEIKGIQLGAILWDERKFKIVRMWKNRYRIRIVEMNNAALFAMQNLAARAKEKGCYLPEHFLLPHRAQTLGDGYDPTRPQGHWYKAWHAMRKEAGKKFPRLLTVRPYDMRHTCITWLLRNPQISQSTVIEVAGWKDERMIKTYHHLHSEDRRKAVESLPELGIVENIA